MRIEITLAKATPLPAGALEALSKELHLRIDKQFAEAKLQLRYASANGITVLGGNKGRQGAHHRHPARDVGKRRWLV
ncbi:DNA-damage-inducible protein I [Sodalis glossinidius str. 'morsitans']|uniref:DNA-damage-inducible protein I n=1 Tax=Sodalis glossinidius (strain morsitans) TaxID=343509 RepID=Q2NU50_SODGM|nr:DinI-like family protein [Sodalis glossinidius]BAE74325.1 DNA-damage-inducible protein I [Sodalis glossinidius str. 'morsitans']CRL44933.1 DNA-damage-inducible protein I [Sodalis glossinidius str. 'morsitans']